MTVFLLKVVLAPALVGAASLAARRWGAAAGGWLLGIPVVAGPILLFYAIDQGNEFAAEAARGALLGAASLACFLILYAATAHRLSWPVSLILGWMAFGAGTILAGFQEWSTPVALAAGSLGLIAGEILLPRRPPPAPAALPGAEILLRMIATGALVLTLTMFSGLMGPGLSGRLAPFPIATSVLTVFIHARQGADGVIHLFNGLYTGLYSFLAFAFVLAVGLVRLGTARGFALALATSITVNGIGLLRLRGKGRRKA
jgi:hypothetical protein